MNLEEQAQIAKVCSGRYSITVIRLTSFAAELASLLVEIGAVKHNDHRLKRFRQEAVESTRSSRHGGSLSHDDNDDDDDEDWS